jgi:hypothetical protein
VKTAVTSLWVSTSTSGSHAVAIEDSGPSTGSDGTDQLLAEVTTAEPVA